MVKLKDIFKRVPTKDELYVKDIVEKFLNKPEVEKIIRPKGCYLIDYEKEVYIKIYNKEVEITNHNFFYKNSMNSDFVNSLVDLVIEYADNKIEDLRKKVIENENNLLRKIYLS